MSSYLLETHCHTSPVSPCSRISPEDIVRRYRESGYGGIIVTDHLYRDQPLFPGVKTWKEKIDRFFSGFRAAREEGLRLGLDVFPGAELTVKLFPRNDLLLIGLTEEFFYTIPRVFSMSYREIARRVHAAGGIVVQAHPYRRGCSPLKPSLLDGVEVFNGNPDHDSGNDRAAAYAGLHGLLATSGSDAHASNQVGSGGVYLSRRPADGKALVELLGEGVQLRRPGSMEPAATS